VGDVQQSSRCDETQLEAEQNFFGVEAEEKKKGQDIPSHHANQQHAES